MEEKVMKYLIKGAAKIATGEEIKEIVEKKDGDKKEQRKYKKMAIKTLKEVRDFAKKNYPDEKKVYMDLAKKMLKFEDSNKK